MNNMDNKDVQYSQTEHEYYRGEQNFPPPPPQQSPYQQTKLCKYCRSQMDVRAAVCPSCRKKQSHPLLTVLLIAAAVFLGIPFCVGFVQGVTKGLNENSVQDVKETSTVKSEPAAKSSHSNINKVAYNKNGIKITYTGIEEKSSYFEIQFLIENNTDKKYCVQDKDFSINGYMINSIMSATVAPHKKMNDGIKVYKSQLTENKIDRVEYIEFKFHIFDWDNWLDGYDTNSIKID